MMVSSVPTTFEAPRAIRALPGIRGKSPRARKGARRMQKRAAPGAEVWP
jgi:hypothetical protein